MELSREGELVTVKFTNGFSQTYDMKLNGDYKYLVRLIVGLDSMSQNSSTLTIPLKYSAGYEHHIMFTKDKAGAIYYYLLADNERTKNFVVGTGFIYDIHKTVEKAKSLLQ